jgi:hypothetical protein
MKRFLLLTCSLLLVLAFAINGAPLETPSATTVKVLEASAALETVDVEPVVLEDPATAVCSLSVPKPSTEMYPPYSCKCWQGCCQNNACWEGQFLVFCGPN